MIPLHKLIKLPLAQGKRKTAKIFEEAEHRFLNGALTEKEIVCLAEILGYWIAIMPAKTVPVLKSILNHLKQPLNNLKPEEIRHDINTAKYIFRTETGRFPAEWDFDATDPGGKLDPAKRKIFAGMEVYLEDIRSPFNVGAMFRTAESFGVEKIYLSPFCADPCHPRAQRTAMGCTEILPWSRVEPKSAVNTETGLAELFPQGTKFFALETGGIPLESFPFPVRGVMIAGSEELGVSPGALAAADASLGRVSIPIFGAKGSLNVSTAFGIAMHAWAVFLEKLSLKK